MYKKIMLIFLILFTVSCAGHEMKVTHEVVKPDGSPYPDPYYSIQTIDPQRPIRVSFFFSGIKTVTDLDGIRVPTQSFLNLKTSPVILSEEGNKIQLIARVLNPRNMKYKVYCKQKVLFHDGGDVEMFSLVAYSDMKYREFNRELPVNSGVKEVTYSLHFTDAKDNLLISTGNFHYFIK